MKKVIQCSDVIPSYHLSQVLRQVMLKMGTILRKRILVSAEVVSNLFSLEIDQDVLH